MSANRSRWQTCRCEGCGATFHPFQSSQRFCGAKCRESSKRGVRPKRPRFTTDALVTAIGGFCVTGRKVST